MALKKSILILGGDGMLGSLAYSYFKNLSKYNTQGSTRKKSKSNLVYFDVDSFLKSKNKYKNILKYDYIINTIGIIKPYCNDRNNLEIHNAIRINALFPHDLSYFLLKNNSNSKIMNISTDCVFSGLKGNYIETDNHDPLDVYGKTKSLGESMNNNIINIRCSIIGPELNHKLSLLEWFLMQDGKEPLEGYSNHLWNGVTTLQFTELCEKIITYEKFNYFRNKSSIFHYVPNKKINKYELLKLFNSIFEKNFVIKKTSQPNSIDRTLKTIFPEFTKITEQSNLKKELIKLKKYIDKNNFYNIST